MYFYLPQPEKGKAYRLRTELEPWVNGVVEESYSASLLEHGDSVQLSNLLFCIFKIRDDMDDTKLYFSFMPASGWDSHGIIKSENEFAFPIDAGSQYGKATWYQIPESSYVLGSRIPIGSITEPDVTPENGATSLEDGLIVYCSVELEDAVQ